MKQKIIGKQYCTVDAQKIIMSQVNLVVPFKPHLLMWLGSVHVHESYVLKIMPEMLHNYNYLLGVLLLFCYHEKNTFSREILQFICLANVGRHLDSLLSSIVDKVEFSSLVHH